MKLRRIAAGILAATISLTAMATTAFADRELELNDVLISDEMKESSGFWAIGADGNEVDAFITFEELKEAHSIDVEFKVDYFLEGESLATLVYKVEYGPGEWRDGEKKEMLIPEWLQYVGKDGADATEVSGLVLTEAAAEDGVFTLRAPADAIIEHPAIKESDTYEGYGIYQLGIGIVDPDTEGYSIEIISVKVNDTEEYVEPEAPAEVETTTTTTEETTTEATTETTEAADDADDSEGIDPMLIVAIVAIVVVVGAGIIIVVVKKKKN